jgi:hypothetical protein
VERVAEHLAEPAFGFAGKKGDADIAHRSDVRRQLG